MRIALLLLVVLAVVLPTVLVPEHYSTQQVTRAFKAEGLPLRLTDSGREWSPGGSVHSEYYFRSRDRQFSVAVFEPTRIRVSFRGALHNADGGQYGSVVIQKQTWRGNVVAAWTPNRLSSGYIARIHAALASLGAYRAH